MELRERKEIKNRKTGYKFRESHTLGFRTEEDKLNKEECDRI